MLRTRTETTQATNQKWLVTAVDPSTSNLLQNCKSLSMLHLPDPSSSGGEQRPYLRVVPAEVGNSTCSPKLYELQTLPPDQEPFNSFFLVGDKKNYIVGDPMLYVVTPMDPLWWCLKDAFVPNDDAEDESRSTKKKLQWQPLDQILPTFPTIVQSHLQKNSNKAVDKLFDQMKLSDDDDDDDIFFRFSETKALTWLQQKQEKVYKVLLQQELDKLAKEISVSQSTNLSTNDESELQTKAVAFCSNFCLGGDAGAGGGEQQQKLSPEEQEKQVAKQQERNRQRREQQEQVVKTRAHRESIQVVCNYLSADWQRVFLKHLQQDEQMILQQATDLARKRKRVQDDGTNTGQDESTTAAKSKKKNNLPPPPRNITAGAKRLAKVNTKGMAKMSSFFTVVSKKK